MTEPPAAMSIAGCCSGGWQSNELFELALKPVTAADALNPQQSIQPVMAKLTVGNFDKRGLGAEGDAETRLLNHQAVVGAVADAKDAAMPQAQLLAGFDERLALGHRIDDGVADLARQLAAREDQPVGAHSVKADRPRDRLGEGQEAAGHEEA